jgi:hypothetical protein
MKLEHPFLQLPLAFDAAAIAAEVEALGEAPWRPHPQGYAGNSALTLISVGGDPDSDAVRGPMRPTPNLVALPLLQQVLHAIGAVWGRTRLMRLSGQAEVAEHVDISYYWREHMRVHVPIVTQPTVRFICGDSEINMAAGECWIFDTWRRHRVINDDHRSRIHLVADTVGGRAFWPLYRAGRPSDRAIAGWAPRRVAAAAGTPALELESVNVPTVMSPYELREHLAFLFGETPPTDAARALWGGVMAPFAREWQALWAKYGDSGEGLVDYRRLRDEVVPQVARAGQLAMRNGVPLAEGLHALVFANVVAADAGR